MKKTGFKLLGAFLIFFSCNTNRNVITEKPVVKEKKMETNYIPYYLKVYEADSLYIAKDYQKSYAILDSLFRKFEPINMINYFEVVNFLRLKIILNKKIETKSVLDLISKYGHSEELIKFDSVLKIYSAANNDYLIKNYKIERLKYENSINIPLRNQIKEMKFQDQFYRKNGYKENMDKQHKIDSINQKLVVEIFNKYGFPNEKIIGNFSFDNTFTEILAILLHTKDKIRQEYFMPKVLEYIKCGKAQPFYYANLQDQLLLYNDKPQYYGSYQNKVDIPVNELNARRKTIGLANYGYEKWRNKKLYPDEKL